jgi:hypothetical protein
MTLLRLPRTSNRIERLIDPRTGWLTARLTVNRVIGGSTRQRRDDHRKGREQSLEAQSQWQRDILREVDSLGEMLDPRETKRYRLSLMRDVAGRLDELAVTCAECQPLREELTNLLRELRQAGSAGQVPDKTLRKDYQKRFAAVMKHLEKTHKLVPPGHYQAVWLAIGPGIGIAAGVALDNTGIGIAVGTGIGLTVGSWLDFRARKEGRVIGGSGGTERDLTSPNKTKFLIIGGVVLAIVAVVALLDRAGIF